MKQNLQSFGFSSSNFDREKEIKNILKMLLNGLQCLNNLFSPVLIDDYNRRSFPEDCLGEVRKSFRIALPQLCKMWFESCAKEIAFPPS